MMYRSQDLGGSYGLVRNDVDWVMSGRGFDSEPPHISQDFLCSQEVFRRLPKF